MILTEVQIVGLSSFLVFLFFVTAFHYVVVVGVFTLLSILLKFVSFFFDLNLAQLNQVCLNIEMFE